jgi:hypothetical protein
VFDEGAGVFDNEETGQTGFFGGGRIFDAELEPNDFGADSDGGFDNRWNVFGAAENVDEVDGLGDVFEAGIGFLAEHFPFIGVDGNDAISGRLQVGGDLVAGPSGIRREANDGDGLGLAENVGNGIGRIVGIVGEIEFHE